MSAPPPVVVSAPGKVLLAGGYLVLDPTYSGVVVSTSSRFYTVIQSVEKQTPAVGDDKIQIRVRSPQFIDATWVYLVVIDGTRVRVEQLADTNVTATKNKFVQLAVERVLSLALDIRGLGGLKQSLATDLDIVIIGDNDFYSQRDQLAARGLPPTLESLSQLPPFLPTGVRLPEVHKTGLGSSAALITSLVSALLLRLSVIQPNSFDSPVSSGGLESTSEGRQLAHNVAQYVHCLAQGKVGSGFDVSSAVFGSQGYRRFGPQVLEPLMGSDDLASIQSLSRILSPKNPAWDYKVTAFKLPPYVRLMLADVDAGSDTPSLVGKVLKWRKEKPEEAKKLWDELDGFNQGLSRTLLQLGELYEKRKEDYVKVVRYLSGLQQHQWLSNSSLPAEETEIIHAFAKAYQLSESIRASMRQMSTLSSTPIEPPSQTRLLDASISVAGAIGGGVPGAGGFDAIWLLVLEPPLGEMFSGEDVPRGRVEAVWREWKEEGMRVSPLAAVESVGRGVRVETVQGVKGLAEVLESKA